MKSTLLGMVITLAALQFAPPPPVPTPPPQRGQGAAPARQPAPLTAAECKCSIDITVKRATGEPLSDVDITMTGAPSARVETDANGRMQIIQAPSASITPFSARTDATGHVVFRGLSEMNYNVRAQRDGYLGALVPGVPIPPNALVNVIVNVGPMANNITPAVIAATGITGNALNAIPQPNQKVAITMIQGATISGRVQDSNRRPASGIQVGAFRVTYRDGQRTLSQAGTMVQTDDRGEYRLFWFPPGEYYIRTGIMTAALIRTQAYPTQTYYPGTLDASRAVAVVLREGQESGGADFAIQSSAGVTVSGNIVNNLPGRTNPNGQVNRSITSVFLVPRDASFMDSPQTLPNFRAGARGADPAGTNTPFEIRNVPPGSYDFYPMFSAPGSSPVAGGVRGGVVPTYYTGRTPIEVGSEDVKGITAVIRPGVDLKGHVTVTGTPPSTRTQPFTMANLRFQLRSIDNLPSITLLGNLASSSVDGNGFFTVPNLIDAQYALSLFIGMPVDAYVSDMRIGSQSVYDDGVITIGKGSPDTLEIVITRGGGTVQGVLHDGQQKPVAATRVVLIPEQPRRQNFLLYKTAQSNAMGNFTISGVSPGAYKLFAWENLPQGAEQNAGFMREYEQRGTSVIVSTGVAAASVQVPLIPDKQ